MSRTYRCRVKKDIKQLHKTSDEMEYKINLLDESHLGILDPDEMEKEYRRTLKDMGAKEDREQNLVIEVDGVKININTKEKTAKATLEEESELTAETEKTIDVYDLYDNREEAKKKAKDKLGAAMEKELEARIEHEKKAHTQKVRKALDKADEKIRQALRKAANETYKKALRKKAAGMGKITEDREDRLDNGNERLTLEIEIA